MNKEEEFQDIIDDGLAFLKSLTRYYGPEKGMEVWESMGDAIGVDVKGAIFFKMLVDPNATKVRFMAYSIGGDPQNAVFVIKAIRQYTGLGLKEAKDAWDGSKIKPVAVKTLDRLSRINLANELRQLGCRVL
jgi:hypothetical protein